MHCPLCFQPGAPFYNDTFFICAACAGIFKHKKYYPDAQAEISRYREHNNDVDDPRYQTFVAPFTGYVMEHFGPDHQGLDFGSGTAPVISKVLRDHNYSIEQFDPFFCNRPELLNATYDYIVCCEVIEHFHRPAAEFKQLHAMLNPGGALICMTHLYDNSVEFKNWYYKNDPTHVFIYSRQTITHIAGLFAFADFEIKGRLIILKK